MENKGKKKRVLNYGKSVLVKFILPVSIGISIGIAPYYLTKRVDNRDARAERIFKTKVETRSKYVAWTAKFRIASKSVADEFDSGAEEFKFQYKIAKKLQGISEISDIGFATLLSETLGAEELGFQDNDPTAQILSERMAKIREGDALSQSRFETWRVWMPESAELESELKAYFRFNTDHGPMKLKLEDYVEDLMVAAEAMMELGELISLVESKLNGDGRFLNTYEFSPQEQRKIDLFIQAYEELTTFEMHDQPSELIELLINSYKDTIRAIDSEIAEDKKSLGL